MRNSIARMMWILGIAGLLQQAAWSAPTASPQTPAATFERATELGSDQHENEFPAIGTDENGKVWTCWIAFDGTNDTVFAAPVDAKDAPPVALSRSAGDHWRPAMARDGSGRLWATWAENENGQWDIWATFLKDGRWAAPRRLTDTPGNDLCQKLTADSGGTLWMAWQSVVNENYEILAAPVTPDGLGTPQNVSDHPASDWEPAIAATSDGRVFVAWDSYRNGSYDILVSEIRNGQAGFPLGVATSSAYEAHATIAVDSQDRLWVAWDNGGTEWGRHNRNGQNLHSERSVGLCCLADGKVSEPLGPLSAALDGALSEFCELPHLMVDGDDRLWLFVRHLTDVTPPGKPGARPPQPRSIWNPYVLCYVDERWSQPVQLPESNGRNDIRTAACLDAERRLWVAWADDGRTAERAEEPIRHRVHTARIHTSVPPGGPPTVKPDGRTAHPADALPPTLWPAPHMITDGKNTYTLRYGDTHRHTDLSRCRMNKDGSLMDTYRYAIDVVRLDFLAITDHDQDILKHRYGRPTSPLQHYAWWRSEKYCDLFHVPGRFVPLYAYEHGGSFAKRGGHKNVLYVERGNPCYEEDAPKELFRVLEGKEVVVIPHQLADGPSATDWPQWDSRYERIAEIFQARGSYEYSGAKPSVSVTRDGHYYWDALAMGVRIGVIASSDHGAINTAYAGVYCHDLSRQSIIQALRSRRTFGAMDRATIDFQCGMHLLGEEIEIDAAPTFRVYIYAPERIRKAQIVKNGQFIHTASPNASTCTFEYTDNKIQPGEQAWYYVRCEYGDERYGWSSPIWAGWKPTAAGR
ncbi:MAG: hypothetical protein JXA69_00295 [Phycisphaerae bacterium]|nr:hypothetical protein [Phycisphaerae bacterium]